MGSVNLLVCDIGDFDARGRIVVQGVWMQLIGYAISPFIAAKNELTVNMLNNRLARTQVANISLVNQVTTSIVNGAARK